MIIKSRLCFFLFVFFICSVLCVFPLFFFVVLFFQFFLFFSFLSFFFLLSFLSVLFFFFFPCLLRVATSHWQARSDHRIRRQSMCTCTLARARHPATQAPPQQCPTTAAAPHRSTLPAPAPQAAQRSTPPAPQRHQMEREAALHLSQRQNWPHLFYLRSAHVE